MLTLKADLHAHTVLSPCAGVEMIPPLIVEEAIQRGIRLVAITDHNATANIRAVQKAASAAAAAAGTELRVLPGMDLQTREEVHVLCLFDEPEQAEALQTWVDDHLPAIPNPVEFFGEQFVVDETGDFIRREERLLSTSADITLRDAWEKVSGLGGLFIPAHVNRPAFGLLPMLGLVPPGIRADALEISRHITPEKARRLYPQIAQYPLTQNGDVHLLGDFLGVNEFFLETRSTSEIRLAFQQSAGRSHHLLPC